MFDLKYDKQDAKQNITSGKYKPISLELITKSKGVREYFVFYVLHIQKAKES